jgi:hypothetical protein
MIRVQCPAEAKEFYFRLYIQTNSEVHPASYPMSVRGPFPGSKVWLGCDADHSPHLVPKLGLSRSYDFSPIAM